LEVNSRLSLVLNFLDEYRYSRLTGYGLWEEVGRFGARIAKCGLVRLRTVVESNYITETRRGEVELKN
jgi:hypothetical protein